MGHILFDLAIEAVDEKHIYSVPSEVDSDITVSPLYQSDMC